MKKLNPVTLLLILPVFILFMTSCANDSCFDETESYLKISFYSNSYKKILAPDSITVFGLGSDSLIYNKKSGVQPALIPLNSMADSSTFIIRINGVSDTLRFHYTTYPHLISKECGFTYYHQLSSDPEYTNHAIINIYTNDKTITNLNVENIRIFY